MRVPIEQFSFAVVFFSALATHFVLLDAGNSNADLALAYGLIFGQGAFAFLLLRPRIDRRRWPHALAAIGIVSLAIVVFHVRGGLVLTSGLPHVLAYSALLLVFAASLMPGRLPIVTYLARAIHGPVSPEVERYTRRVTWSWCIFCALQLIGSASLLLLAPVAWWSTFVNLLNLPLVALMFVGERLTRPLWVANAPREVLSDMLRMPALIRESLRRPSADAL